jgi:HD-like signal output (HDOD) protein
MVGSSEDQTNRISDALGADWQVSSASSGESALGKMAAGDTDVLLSAESLPEMSGTELIRAVSKQHPATVRFLMYNESEKSVVAPAVSAAHQFVPLPLDPTALDRALNQSTHLRDILNNEALTSRINAIGSLPSPPKIYNRLVAELSSENANLQKIASLISHDVGITAKVLQVVNSAYFGLPNQVSSVLHATNMLGLDTVTSIVISAGAFQQFEAPKIAGYSVESVHSHGVALGVKSRLLATAFGLTRKLAEDALLAGMLSNIGQVVMLAYFAREFRDAIDLAKAKNIPLDRAEQESFGVSDTKLGAYLLSLWGVPDPILEAVALRGVPHQTTSPSLNALAAVHLAYATDWDENHNVRDNDRSAVDMPYVKSLGLDEQLESLRGFCSAEIV